MLNVVIPISIAFLAAAPVGAGPTPAQTPPQFAFQYSVGQSFRIHMAGGHTSMAKHAERHVSDYVVEIRSRDVKGWHATETVSNGAGRKSFAITIADSGVWTSDADGTVASNLVSFDPRMLCAPPPALVLHASWSCTVLGTRLHPGGNETVSVTALTPESVTLSVSGSTSENRESRIDPDNGGAIDLHTKTTWQKTVTFVRGRTTRVDERDVHSFNVPGTSAHGQTIVDNVMTSE